ncbi:putative trafficking protein particle complex subunit [Paratrimastix pyriformis]|uniref:Trafficking protein particle complex subunit n=1 Tax=Paratrimastix pyriformis TaxID=342808 RepID=A0ABQ8UPV2_9EUKA|nr:putative trafficking protein particle complex subunit [Paratrimastix pyriformis]
MNVFVIVGKDDNPIYQAAFISQPKGSTELCHLHQFLIHAALDCTDEQVWTTNSLFLRAVDFFHEMHTSAYVTPGHCRFMMLHDQPKIEDNLKNFFLEAHELYLKVILNPFYEPNTPITSPAFDAKIRALGKKYLS